jgi:CHAD domain-containing protein
VSQGTNGFFILPGGLDQAAFESALPNHTVDIQMGTAAPVLMLDCHDQSLRSSGRVLLENRGSLRLVSMQGQVSEQHANGKGQFVQNLPDGPVKAALSGFPTLRALTPIGAGEVGEGTLAILDDLQKTQVRGHILSLRSDRGQVAFVWLQQLRGYDRAFAAACESLEGMTSGGIDDVFDALFPDVARYRAKPEIALGTQEPSLEVATDLIRTYLSVARQNEAGIVADIDTEFLHDYRVSLRRIRSVVSLFKGVFSDQQTAALKRVFSDLMAPTGRLRDLDVYLLEKDMYLSLVPENLHAGVLAMFDRFEQERARELSRLTRHLRGAPYETAMTNLAQKFSSPDTLLPGPSADRGAYSYACALIWKRYRKTCKLARSISEETPDQTVHDLRIDCKKLRYLMEFFAPLFNAKDFKTILKPLKKLQDNLGLFNDYSVQQEALLAFVADQSTAQGRVDAQLGLAAGGLIAVLDQRQKAERARVISNFQHFDSLEIRHLFRSLFHHTKE